MAWRPYEQLIRGELDNRTPGVIKGYMIFAGLKGKIHIDLTGDFYKDIKGKLIKLKGGGVGNMEYMRGFSLIQKGKAGDISAGFTPESYCTYPYIEWYSKENGRVVLELGKNQVTVVES